MKMELKDYPSLPGLIAGLKLIVDFPGASIKEVKGMLTEQIINDQEDLQEQESAVNFYRGYVKDFYQEIHQAQKFEIPEKSPLIDASPAILLLVARIAATSPTLKVVSIYSSLGQYGSTIAKALAESGSIDKVVYGNGKYEPTIVQTADISYNNLCQYKQEIVDIFRNGKYVTELKAILLNMHDSQDSPFLPKDLVDIVGDYASPVIEFMD